MASRAYRVTPLMERFRRETVWHPINTDPDDIYRSGPLFWFPSYDVIALILGVYAYNLGSPILNRLFPSWFTDGLGIVMIAASILCLIGVCFPRFVLMELIGKLAIVFMLGGYAGTIMFLSTSKEPNGFVVIVLIMSVWLLGPRVTTLLVKLQKKRNGTET